MKKTFFIVFISQLLVTSCIFDGLTPVDGGTLKNAGAWLYPIDEIVDGYKLVYKKGDKIELRFTIEPDFNTFKRYTCVGKICNANDDPKNVRFIDEGKGFVEDDYKVHFDVTKDNADKLPLIVDPDDGLTRLSAVIPIEMLFPGEKNISCYITTNKGYSVQIGFHVIVVE